MGQWRALSTSSVREDAVRLLLTEEGLAWESVSHITATRSLASSVLETGQVGLPIAALIDLLTAPGLPGDLQLSLEGFPGTSVLASGRSIYMDAVSAWEQKAAGRRLRLGIRFDDALRKYVRSEISDPALRRIFVRSRRELWRTFQTLSAAGIHPADVSPGDVVGRAAVAAWSYIEQHMPEMAFMRDSLWVDFEDFESQSTDVSRDVLRRLDEALSCAFGPAAGPRTIVHHGFHFFTPPQWALFQLLRRTPGIDQVFLIHDDQLNPAFEIWRRFHVEKWHMPLSEVKGQMSEVTAAARMFKAALNGEAIDATDLSESVRVIGCSGPADLVRQWRFEAAGLAEDEASPHYYAADAKSVDRFVRRLGRQEVSGEPVDLAQLPVGAFLLAVHDCIRPRPSGDVVVSITPKAVTEMVASGYVDVAESSRSVEEYLPIVKRALPFFRDCGEAAAWRERERSLRRLIVERVDAHGPRIDGVSDAERIQRATGNPLRLVPWADLSADDVDVAGKVILSCVAVVEEIVSRERTTLGDHLLFLRTELEKGMANLPAQDQQRILAKIEGFSVGVNEEVDVEGLVDIVTMLLSRAADFDATGEPGETLGAVSELRALDSLGFRRVRRDIHVTNLAEGSFPSQVRAVGWPFQLEDLRGEGASADSVVVEILEARSQTAGLGDLYLLWLALDGVDAHHRITLSWIAHLGGEHRNPSALLLLLAEPPNATPAVKERAGGVRIEGVKQAFDAGVLAERIDPSSASAGDGEFASALEKIDPRAAASALACPRRFALQWAMGPSAAFQSEHHHAMLLGNVEASLVREGSLNEGEAQRVSEDLWAHLTAGERESSRAKRRVQPTGASADATWTLTLAGGRTGDGPSDLAYQAAIHRHSPRAEVVVPADSVYLPPGVDDPSVCAQCPVRPRCAVSVDWQDG